jgi:anti-sigma factor RsiW
MTSAHITNEKLNLLLDGRLDPNEGAVMHAHLADCPTCRAAFHSLENIHTVMKTQRIERVSDGFTFNVLTSLKIAPQRLWLYRVVENLSALFALMIVVVLMLCVFIATGALGTKDLQQTQTTVSRIGHSFSGWSASFAGAINDALHKYVPFFYNAGTTKFLFLLGSSFVLLMLFDRFLKRRISVRH